MLQALFHAWERRLSDITKDRVVRPFEWGLDWIFPPLNTETSPEDFLMREWVARIMADTDAFFTPPPTRDYLIAEGPWPAPGSGRRDRLLTFPSALETPHPANNIVHCRVIEPRTAPKGPRAAVVVLPQWNAD